MNEEEPTKLSSRGSEDVLCFNYLLPLVLTSLYDTRDASSHRKLDICNSTIFVYQKLLQEMKIILGKGSSKENRFRYGVR